MQDVLLLQNVCLLAGTGLCNHTELEAWINLATCQSIVLTSDQVIQVHYSVLMPYVSI